MGNWPGVGDRILMQDYKSLGAAVMTCASLVNTHSDTHIYTQVQGHLSTRNSSGDEIANVNFLHDDIVHVLENTIESLK